MQSILHFLSISGVLAQWILVYFIKNINSQSLENAQALGRKRLGPINQPGVGASDACASQNDISLCVSVKYLYFFSISGVVAYWIQMYLPQKKMIFPPTLSVFLSNICISLPSRECRRIGRASVPRLQMSWSWRSVLGTNHQNHSWNYF